MRTVTLCRPSAEGGLSGGVKGCGDTRSLPTRTRQFVQEQRQNDMTPQGRGKKKPAGRRAFVPAVGKLRTEVYTTACRTTR